MRARIAIYSSFALAVAALPMLASAQNITSVLYTVSLIFNSLIGVFVTIAIVVFFWGLIKYLAEKGAEGSSEGLKIMFWGLITLIVMVSVWGILRLVIQTFQIGDNRSISPAGIGFNQGASQTQAATNQFVDQATAGIIRSVTGVFQTPPGVLNEPSKFPY